jgi:hypothetical protein
MPIGSRIYRIADRALMAAHLRPKPDRLESFCVATDQRELLRKQAEAHSVAGAFFDDKGRPVDKWHHYLDIYERHLSRYKGKRTFFLEIGVCDGGSLDMWRRYLGDQAVIVGIDEQCAKRVEPPNIVRIGSQDDPDFLQEIIAEFGAPDVVLDDGSHIGAHQRASFEVLFDALKEDGLYVIEDLHTSYWTGWQGGYRRKGTAIELIKQMLDDVHVWYHKRPKNVVRGDAVGAIHVYDSMVVIEKAKRCRPSRLYGGTRS